MHAFEQILSLVGATLVLAAYLAYQRDRLDRSDRIYNVLNLVGSLCLLTSAMIMVNWGFIALNLVWAWVSLRPSLDPPAPKSA